MKTETKERPKCFTGEEVRAILEDRKTQFREVVKPQPDFDVDAVFRTHDGTWQGYCQDEPGDFYPIGRYWRCPYGQVGARLWASRITLEITDVRVERLQEISVDDAISEGIEPASLERNLWKHYQNKDFNGGNGCDPLTSFKSFWDSINAKKHSWSSNSWVWVIEFKRIEQE